MSIPINCPSYVVDAKHTDCSYEPGGQEFGWTLFEELPPIAKTDDPTDIFSIGINNDIPELKKRL